jgi:mRNA interferase MazF
MRPGDLVLIRFPQADLRQGKLRPAVVVALAPGRHRDVLLALITSRNYQAVPDFDEVINPSDSDYAITHLKIASVVRLSRLASVAPEIIEARLGRMSPERIARIRKRLATWLSGND